MLNHRDKYKLIETQVIEYLKEIWKTPARHFSGVVLEKIKSWDIKAEIVEYLLQKWRETIQVKDKDWKPVLINWKPLKFTKFDFKRLPEYSDDELKIIILADTWIDLFSNIEWWLHQINFLLKIANTDETLWFLSEIFKYKKIPRLQSDFKFKSLEELFNFMRSAWPETPEAKSKCIMMKVISWVADAIRTPWLEDLDKKLKELLENLTLILWIRDFWDIKIWKKWDFWIEIFWRSKTFNSLLLKTLWDPEYDKVSNAKDPVWLTFEINGWWKKEYLELFWDVLNGCLALWWKLIEIKSKWIPKDDIIKFICNNEDLNWIKWIENIKEEKKSWTTEWYMDLKFIIQFWDTKTEIKITPHENQNQEWLNFQWIYAMLNRYIEWFIIRHLNDWYITEEELKMIAEIFFTHLQKILNDNPEITWMSKEEFLFWNPEKKIMWLWEDMQKKWLIRWDVKPKKNLDTTIKSYFIPWLVQYFKSKLVWTKFEDWKIVWRNERSKVLYES